MPPCLRDRAVPADRARGLHVLPRLRAQPGRTRLRRAQHRPGLLRDRGLHRHAQLARRPVDPRHLAAVQVRPSGGRRLAVPWRRPARRRGRPTGAACCRPATSRSAAAGQSAVGDRAAAAANSGTSDPGAAHRRTPPGGRRWRRRVPAGRDAGSSAPACLSRWPWSRASATAGTPSVKTRLLAPPAVTHQTWFAPYVDVTLTPTYQFQNPSARPGAAERPRLRGGRPSRDVHPELGRRVHARRGQPAARPRHPHRAAAAGGRAGHRVVRRAGQHQPGRRLPDRGRAHRRLPVRDQRLSPHHDRPGHRGGRAGQLRRRAAARGRRSPRSRRPTPSSACG